MKAIPSIVVDLDGALSQLRAAAVAEHRQDVAGVLWEALYLAEAARRAHEHPPTHQGHRTAFLEAQETEKCRRLVAEKRQLRRDLVRTTAQLEEAMGSLTRSRTANDRLQVEIQGLVVDVETLRARSVELRRPRSAPPAPAISRAKFDPQRARVAAAEAV